jgi:exodeoxyribonuclease VII small subunit
MAKAPPKTFESALEELERLVADLEGGKLPLADSLTAYKRGAELLKYAQSELAQVEQQVKVLEGDVLKPFSLD